MHPVLSFHAIQSPDNLGRMLSDYWSWDDRTLKTTHDYIQWMFPTWVASRLNPAAPTLDEETREAFLADSTPRTNLRRSLDRMLAFYGLPFSESSLVIDATPCMNGIANRWLTSGNYNLLRITRILSSCHTLGLAAESEAFGRTLESLAPFFLSAVTSETLRYWRDATRLPQHKLIPRCPPESKPPPLRQHKPSSSP
jgi:hypothetical protein